MSRTAILLFPGFHTAIAFLTATRASGSRGGRVFRFARHPDGEDPEGLDRLQVSARQHVREAKLPEARRLPCR